MYFFFFFQAEDGIRDLYVTGVQTCALPILDRRRECSLRLIPSIPLTIVEPRRLIGSSDSFFADLKPSRIGSQANQIRPARSKNMIPNGLRTWPAPSISAQKA